jgi:hypothetical protein
MGTLYIRAAPEAFIDIANELLHKALDNNMKSILAWLDIHGIKDPTICTVKDLKNPLK